MPLFHRRDDETLNEKLLREAGYPDGGNPLETAAEDDTGIAEEQDEGEKTVFWLDEPELTGTAYDFVTLADRSMIVDESAPDVSSIADAVEQELEPPYHVSAVKQSDGYWLVTAEPIGVELFALDGDDIEVSSLDGAVTVTIDGAEADAARVPVRLMRIGEATASDFVVRATRIDGDLWEVRADPL